MRTTLLLNTDCQPVSFLPLSTLSWQESIRFMVLQRAHVLEWYADWEVHSERWSTMVPAVMMLHQRQRPRTQVRFSKNSVFLRDGWQCQYCSATVTPRLATVDHVLPVSLGGHTTFENCVTACAQCNANKGNNPRIVPRHAPQRPSYWSLVAQRRRQGWADSPPQWQQWLPAA